MKLLSKLFICVAFWLTVGGIHGEGNAFGADADHLLINEVVIRTRVPFSTFGSPYIQIFNPTDGNLDLSQVYLTDGTTYPVAYYYHLPLNDPESYNPGGGNGGEFHARFPDGYVLAAGDSLAISINGSTEYMAAYGRSPDFELYEDGLSADAIPEMKEVFPGSINAGLGGGSNVPAFSEISESLVLYTWDGSSDLVQDLDYLLWGTLDAVRIDKTGVTIGSGTYAPDTPTSIQEPVALAGAGFRHAFRRISSDEGTEIPTGGNGLTGHDETSENLATTWQDVDVDVAGIGVPSAPDILHSSAPIFLSAGSTPLDPYGGQDVQLDISLVSYSNISSVTFHYNVDGGVYQDLPGTWMNGDYYATVPSQIEGSVLSWYCTAENVDGGLSEYPVAAPLYLHGWTVSETPAPNEIPTKLLITEVCTIGTSEEFVEICNPSDHAVDMSNYYLGDAVYYDQGYWNIGGEASQTSIGGGIYTDFQARFPDGFMLAAGDTIVISVAGSWDFATAFGFLPDLELYEDDYAADAIPDMRPVFETADGNSIVTMDGAYSSYPTLTNSGESLALYHWVEGNDLVTDIDIFIWGPGVSYFINKTGRIVGDSTYLPEHQVDSFTPPPTIGYSYTRVDATEGTQISTGSNGVMGRDETSENWTQTFEILPVNPSQGEPLFPVEGEWQNVWPPDGGLGLNTNHAWGDINEDGLDDIYLVNAQEGVDNRLFLRQVGGTFIEDFSHNIESGESDRAAAWADLFNDEDLDLIVARSPGPNICFYHNYHDTGGEYFWGWSEGGMQVENSSVALAWVDHDHDGQLEVFVANEGSAAQLLFSQYLFFDFTPEDLLFPDGCRNFAWCDFDVDMDTDLCVITDNGQIHILTNVGTGQYTLDILEASTAATNCSWADFDNDGDFDLVVTFSDLPNILFQNNGPKGFISKLLPEMGGAADSRQAIWGDYDNDGFLDIYVANYNSPNLLLHNENGTGEFLVVYDDDVSLNGYTRAVSWNDSDEDGDLDLFISSLSGNLLMRNNLDNGNHYLTVRVNGSRYGQQANISAVGALIKVTAGGKTQWRSVPGDGSTKVQNFGLGDATVVDEVVVYWPYNLLNGQSHTSSELNVAADQRLEISERLLGLSGTPDNSLPAVFALLPCHPNPFNPMTTITFDIPRDGKVDLEIFDLSGRRIRTFHLGEIYVAGRHEVIWNGKDDQGRGLASGVYQIRLKAKGFEGVQRVTMIK